MLSNSSRSLENNVSCFRFPVFQTDNIPELTVVFNSTVNFPLPVLTTVGNTLVLVAVWRTPSADGILQTTWPLDWSLSNKSKLK